MRRFLFCIILIQLYHVTAFANTYSDSTKKIIPFIFSRLASPVDFTMTPLFTSSVHSVFVGGDAILQSNAISPSFLYSIYNSDFLGDAQKVAQYNRLGDKNAAELQAAGGISYSWKKDGSKFTHTIGLYQRSINELKFGSGLFYLTFFGNGNAEKATIDLGDNEADFMQFRQLQYSLMYDASPTFKVYGGISLLQGTNYQHVIVNNGSLYTDTLGEAVILSYDLNYANNTGGQWYQMSGQGFSLDGGFVYTTDPSRYVFSAGFNDLGYITWNSQSNLYAGTGSKNFTGLQVGNLFAITDTTFNNINKDSILHYLQIAQAKGKAMDNLPFSMNASYEFRTDKNYIWSLRASYIPAFYWYPRLEVRGGKFITDRISVLINAGTGGFEKFFAGVSIYGNFPVKPSSTHNESISWSLSSDHITSLIFPNAMTGASIRAGIGFNF